MRSSPMFDLLHFWMICNGVQDIWQLLMNASWTQAHFLQITGCYHLV